MRTSGLLLAVLSAAVPCISFAGNNTYFRSLDEIVNWVVTELSAGGKRTIDEKKIEIQSADLNGDGENDYWLFYPGMGCGKWGCYGFVFLQTDKGYCLVEPEIGKQHFVERDFKKTKCAPW